MHMIPLGLYIKIIQKEEGSKRGTIVSPENELATHGKWKTIHVNKARHTRELEWKKKKLDPFIDVTSIFRLQSLYSPLSGIWTELQIRK